MYLRSRGNSVHQDLDACQKVFAVSSACAVIVVACLALFLDESSDSFVRRINVSQSVGSVYRCEIL
jgi:hypothetical protein